MNKNYDPRITPIREDLAADFLRDVLPAKAYVPGKKFQIEAMVADLVAKPQSEQSLQSQLLYGEEFTVYEQKNGWSWGQAGVDDYVGYVRTSALTAEYQPPDHRVIALRTAVFSKPDLKSPIYEYLHCNSLVSVTQIRDSFRKTQTGWVHCGDLAALSHQEFDWVVVAQKYLHAPYVWGGRSSFGLDCSALVQNALLAAGVSCPRDSDMQEASLGEPVVEADKLDHLRRGDLVFWDGHVGIMLDAEQLLHANAYHMATTIEPLSAAIGRIQKTSGSVSSIRRFV